MPLRILHLSDTHFGATGSFRDGSSPLDRPDVALDRTLSSLSGPIDAIVHTGDIADDLSEPSARLVQQRLASYGVPLLGVPGNHDDPAAVADVFGRSPIEVGEWRIIGADTVIAGEIHGSAERVLEQVDAYDERPTVIAIHHPIRSRSTHRWFSLAGAAELLSGLRERPHVRALLTGHTHQQFEHVEPWGLRHLGGLSTYYGMSHDGDAFTYQMSDVGAQVIELDGSDTITTARI